MIGWYVHHHGRGHLRRFQTVSAELRVPVTVLSSLVPPEGNDRDWLELADDAGPGVDRDDVGAGGTLHWAPRHHCGLAKRTAQLTTWLHDVKPSLVLVDVSVEVSLLTRLAGIPVVLVAMPGDRSDRPHATAYDLADALIAAWPEHVLTTWPRRWVDKTHFVGVMSRFDRVARPHTVPERGGNRALLLWGEGGRDRMADFVAMQRATPGWDWRLAQPSLHLGDDALWEALCTADVVVTHAGQGALGDVAAAGTPAVVVADERPFDEQLHTVRALNADRVAVGLEDWPDPERWPALLDQARGLTGEGWRTWSSGWAAVRVARAVELHAGARASVLSTPRAR
jgi:hypothetical protein